PRHRRSAYFPYTTLFRSCLLRQTYPPDKIILWLAKEQFEGRNTLPNNLLDLEKRGLEIVFCDEDLRSHKKYYYAIKKFSKDILRSEEHTSELQSRFDLVC